MTPFKITKNYLLLLALIFSLVSCSNNISDDSSSDTKKGEYDRSDGTIRENLNGGSNSESNISQILFTQDFESFEFTGTWFLSDFGLNKDSERSEYVTDNKINFHLFWTKKTRNLLAERMGIEKSLMTNDYANSICEPKIEIGEEQAYGGSNLNNILAELDSDLLHCNIHGNEPAALKIRSFIPTQIGHNYKVEVDYKMRRYRGQTDKSYKNLVVRFGQKIEKFDPVFDNLQTVFVETVSVHKFTKLVLQDNGLPDSFGVLIDNIKVTDLGKVENYGACKNLFKVNSKGFKKCVLGEIETNQSCNFENIEDIHTKYIEGKGVVENRKVISNIFNQEGIIQGKINFLSLGLKGKLLISCTVGGHLGLFDIYKKNLKLKEISWGNATLTNYPELAKVRVKLEDCDADSLNRIVTIATLGTKESLDYVFNVDEDGISFSGCKMSKLIIKDITPDGPSKDGIDLNSFELK